MALTKIGKYDVLRPLGKGPSGDAYLAEDRGNGHRVVLKLLEGSEGLVDQARRVAALSHPHLGAGQVGLHGNTPFFATEYFAGATLSEWLSGNPPLPERLRVVEALADALCHAHEQGVVHGALEPSVVRIADDGDCKLTDFELGASREVPAASTAYRAPEVLQGGAYTQKSEVHAAGVLFYEALAGKNPFARGTPAATKEAVLNDLPQPLVEVRKDVPRDLSDAIMACFEKDPDWRPKDLSYILEVVRRGGAAKKPAVRSAAPARAAAVPTKVAAPTFAAVGPRQRSGSRAPLMAAVGVGALALAAGAWFWLRPPSRDTAQGTTGRPSTTVPTPKPDQGAAAGATPAALATPTPGARTPPPSPTEAGKPSPKQAAAEGQFVPPSALAPLGASPGTGGGPKVASATAAPEVEARPTVAPPTTEPPRTTSAGGAAADAGGTGSAGTTGPVAGVPAPSLPPAAQEQASLRNLTPPILKRPATTMLDVHGAGLRVDHQAIVFKGKEVARGISVVRQRVVNANLVQVVLLVDASVSPGVYTIAFTDSQGNITNSLRFEVGK